MMPSAALARAPVRAATTFFGGMRALLASLGFIMTKPSVWGWAMIPMVVAAGLFTVAVSLGLWGAAALAARIVGDQAGTWGHVGAVLVEIVTGILAIVVALLVAMSFAQPLSGFALDAISRRQEAALGGGSWADSKWLLGAFRSLRVTLLGLVVGLPLLAVLAVVSVVFPPAAVVCVPLKFVVTALLIAWDFLDYPLSLHGVRVRDRVSWIRANFWAVLGFGVACALLLLVPGLGLLLLPVGVAGGTRLVVLADKR